MKTASPLFPTDNKTLFALPGWVTSLHGKDLETLAFSSGAALALLDAALRDPEAILPGGLLRDRLALGAAGACLRLEGRRDSAAEIRDAWYLTRAGDAMGPAGTMFGRWRKVGAIALNRADWATQVTHCVSGARDLPGWIRHAGQGSPVARAARVTGRVLAEFPRQETLALICGDVVLARAFGWTHPVPLLALHMRRRDVRATGDDLIAACHRAVAAGAQAAGRLAGDLTRRAQRLRAIAPGLRAKGSGAAVALFLSEDAVLPGTMLSPRIKGSAVTMSDRAARRLCDRLVELGGVREMTGRDTFRLYGVG